MPRRRARPKSESVTVEKLLEDPYAREAIEKLTTAGAPREQVLELVLAIPGASHQVEPLVRGIERRTLRVLPDRIKKLAGEIRTVNNSLWLSPTRLLHIGDFQGLPAPLSQIAKPESAKLAADIFPQVPAILGLYAEHLRALLDYFHPLRTRKRVGESKEAQQRGVYDRFVPATLLKLRLIWLVRIHTRAPHHGEIATLLEEAYRASGQAGESVKIDADFLKKLERNNRELRLIAFPFDAQSTTSPRT